VSPLRNESARVIPAGNERRVSASIPKLYHRPTNHSLFTRKCGEPNCETPSKKKPAATEPKLPRLAPEVEALLDVLLSVQLRRALVPVPVPTKGAQQAGREGSAAVHPEEKGQGEADDRRR
jgi:hypothetical protein